jgi:hypothetical protein
MTLRLDVKFTVLEDCSILPLMAALGLRFSQTSRYRDK